MDKKQFEGIMNTKRKGVYMLAQWQQVNLNGIKISTGVIRMTNHEVKTSKEGNDYVNFRITKNPNHHIKTIYFNHNGEQITKEQYGENSYTVTDWFRKRLEDVIYIK